jgi:tRNA 2-thiouridine synthesizing protein A
MSEPAIAIDSYLDLRQELCPLNYVKTKLRLEQLAPGQVLEIWITGESALQNVPRSVREDGHDILRVTGIEDYFSLLIRKAGAT